MVLNGELGGQDQNHSSWKSGFHSCVICLESPCLMQTRKDRPAETLIPVTNVTRHIHLPFHQLHLPHTPLHHP